MHFHLELSSSKNFLFRNFKNKFFFLPISMKAKVRNVQCARKGKEFAEITAANIYYALKELVPFTHLVKVRRGQLAVLCHYLAMNGKVWVQKKFSTHI